MKKLLIILMFVPLISFGQDDKNVLSIQNYNQGLDFYNNNNYGESIDYFSKAIEYNSDDLLSYFYRASAKLYILDPDYYSILFDLNKFFSLGIKLNPENLDNSLVAYARYIEAIANRELKDFKKSISSINRAIELDPNNSSYYSQRAGIYYFGIFDPFHSNMNYSFKKSIFRKLKKKNKIIKVG